MDFTDIAKVRDRLAEKEKELEGKDRIIQELMEKLREVKEDRAFYKRILEDERAKSVRATETAIVDAVTAQLDLLPSKFKALLSVQHVDAAISTEEGSTASNNSRVRGAQVSPLPPPEEVVPAKTAAGTQVGANEVPSLQGRRPMFSNASLNLPSPVGGLWGSLASAQKVSLFDSPLAPPAKSGGPAGETKAVRASGDSPTIPSGSSGVAGGPSTGFAAIGAAASKGGLGGFGFGPPKSSSNAFPNSQFTFQVPHGLNPGSSKSSAPKGLPFPLWNSSATELGQKRI